jgi:hypothetical protein
MTIMKNIIFLKIWPLGKKKKNLKIWLFDGKRIKKCLKKEYLTQIVKLHKLKCRA